MHQLTSKECLSVVAPGQTHTLHRGRCGETVDIQLINQCFTLQILSAESGSAWWEEEKQNGGRVLTLACYIAIEHTHILTVGPVAAHNQYLRREFA